MNTTVGIAFLMIGLLGALVSMAFGQLRRVFLYMKRHSDRIGSLEEQERRLLITLVAVGEMLSKGAPTEQIGDFLRRATADTCAKAQKEDQWLTP